MSNDDKTTNDPVLPDADGLPDLVAYSTDHCGQSIMVYEDGSICIDIGSGSKRLTYNPRNYHEINGVVILIQQINMLKCGIIEDEPEPWFCDTQDAETFNELAWRLRKAHMNETGKETQ